MRRRGREEENKELSVSEVLFKKMGQRKRDGVCMGKTTRKKYGVKTRLAWAEEQENFIH